MRRYSFWRSMRFNLSSLVKNWIKKSLKSNNWRSSLHPKYQIFSPNSRLTPSNCYMKASPSNSKNLRNLRRSFDLRSSPSRNKTANSFWVSRAWTRNKRKKRLNGATDWSKWNSLSCRKTNKWANWKRNGMRSWPVFRLRYSPNPTRPVQALMSWLS